MRRPLSALHTKLTTARPAVHAAMALTLAALLAWPDAAWAARKAATPARIDGQVVDVIDGDSLRVIDAKATDKPPIEVRLHGIDAPEGCQAGGPEAREALRAHVAGKSVTLVTRGKDDYQRTLAVLEVDGVDINERLVAEGHAWSLRFKWDKGPYVDKERVAKTLKRGLHATPGAMLPADFRRQHGRCEGPPTAPASGATS